MTKVKKLSFRLGHVIEKGVEVCISTDSECNTVVCRGIFQSYDKRRGLSNFRIPPVSAIWIDSKTKYYLGIDDGKQQIYWWSDF